MFANLISIKTTCTFAVDQHLNEVYNFGVNRLVVLLVIVTKDQPEHLANVEHILADLLLSDEFFSALLAFDVWCLWIR